jgi:hypothetical protein
MDFNPFHQMQASLRGLKPFCFCCTLDHDLLALLRSVEREGRVNSYHEEFFDNPLVLGLCPEQNHLGTTNLSPNISTHKPSNN